MPDIIWYSIGTEELKLLKTSASEVRWMEAFSVCGHYVNDIQIQERTVRGLDMNT